MNGDSQSEVKSKIEKLSQKMNRLNLSYAITKLYEPSKIAQVWAMRQAGLGLMMNIPGDEKPIPFVEDTAVSPEKLPEYVKRFDEIVRTIEVGHDPIKQKMSELSDAIGNAASATTDAVEETKNVQNKILDGRALELATKLNSAAGLIEDFIQQEKDIPKSDSNLND